MSEQPAYDYSEFTKDQEEQVLSNLGPVLAAKAQEQLQAEARVLHLEEQLAEANAALTRIKEHELPELMDQAQLSETTTKDGVKIRLGEVVRGSIPKANEDKAFEWLNDSNNSGLIKRQFIIEFSNKEEAWARKFQRDLSQRKKPVNCKIKRAVAPQTLQAFVRQKLEAGEVIPMDLLGVYRQRLTKVSVPEKK